MQIFMRSKVLIRIDTQQLPNNRINAVVVFKPPNSPDRITNLKITQIVNGRPVGQGPNIDHQVIPTGLRQVVLRVVVSVPNLGSKTKTIFIPVINGSKSQML